METLARLLAWIIVALVLAQTAMVVRYVIFLCRFKRPPLPDGECPRAAAILCVRGLDPFLAASVRGLLQQDYPDYKVYIVVDSVRDPAWPVVKAMVKQAGRGNVSVLALTDRLPTTTRKAAGQLQALAKLDPSREIVAMLDGDTIPHSTWLRELAAPLKDPRVGVASGNRWYMPAADPLRGYPATGSLVRIFGTPRRSCRCSSTRPAGAGRWLSRHISFAKPTCDESWRMPLATTPPSVVAAGCTAIESHSLRR